MIYVNNDKINELSKYGFIKLENNKYVLFDDKSLVSGKYEPIFTILKIGNESFGKLNKYDFGTLTLLYNLIIDKIIYKIDERYGIDLINERKKE